MIELFFEHPGYIVGCLAVSILSGAFFSLKEYNGFPLLFACTCFVCAVDVVLLHTSLLVSLEILKFVIGSSIFIMVCSIFIFHSFRDSIIYRYRTFVSKIKPSFFFKNAGKPY